MKLLGSALGWAGLIMVAILVYGLCAGGSWWGVIGALVVGCIMYRGYRRGRNTNSQ